MPRTITRAQALENAAFLRHLAATGNARAAAAALDLSRSRFTKRRAADPAFAARWDAALAFAHASLSSPREAGGGGPSRHAMAESASRLHRPQADGMRPEVEGRRPKEAETHRSTHIPHPTRTPSGRFQLRRRPKTAITPEAEQAFLTALAATANVHLAATAAGFAHSSFYTRKRTHPAFAREWRFALQQGYDRVETALLASWSEDAAEQDAWRHNAPPPIPPMTANQALQLMYLHQKEVLGHRESPHTKRRRGESGDAHRLRLAAMAHDADERAREQYRVGEALRAEARAPRSPHEPPPPVLPDLAQVTGWSKADPAKAAHDEGRALFGGWRIGDWEERKR